MADIKLEVKVEGFDHLLKAFADLGSDAMPYLKDAINAGAEKIADSARQKAPARPGSGKLKASIKAKKAKESQKSGVTKAEVYFTEPYGVPVELGHGIVTHKGKIVGHAEARPFMRPAFDEHKEEVFYGMIDGMNEALEKMGGLK
jgi:HK97 gp10 family phage protein